MTITSSPSAKLVAVVGSTGLQGGSVIDYLEKSAKEYRVRGFTRSPSKADHLKNRGVEVVQLDVNAENQDSMKEAFQGADVVFGMTNFWDHGNEAKEIADGKAMIQAAVDAKVSLFVWAGLTNFTKSTKGKYTHVEHFDSKAEVSDFGRSVRSETFKFAVVQPGHYNSNVATFAQPTGQTVDGKPAFVWSLPTDGKVATFDIADYGLWVQAAIENPELQGDEDVLAAVAEITGKEIAETISKNSSAHVDFYPVDAATYKSYLPPNMAEELTQMYQSFGEFGYFGGADWKKFHKYLETPPKTFEEWAKTAQFGSK